MADILELIFAYPVICFIVFGAVGTWMYFWWTTPNLTKDEYAQRQIDMLECCKNEGVVSYATQCVFKDQSVFQIALVPEKCREFHTYYQEPIYYGIACVAFWLVALVCLIATIAKYVGGFRLDDLEDRAENSLLGEEYNKLLTNFDTRRTEIQQAYEKNDWRGLRGTRENVGVRA
jgi:hypothetical protein